MLRKLGVATATCYLSTFALLLLLQEAMIFPSPRVSETDLRAAADREGIEIVALEAADGTALTAWFLDGGDRGTVLHFLGNGEALHGALPIFAFAREHGFDAAAVAYRGYPGSEGRPSADGLCLDARALYDHVVDARGEDPDRVVISSMSIGSGPAIALAAEVRPGGLLLQSAFTRLSDVAGHRVRGLYPVRTFLRHRFDNVDQADRLPANTLIVHGEADSIVPVAHGRALHAAIARSDYVEIPGGTHLGYATADPRARYLAGQLLDRAASGLSATPKPASIGARPPAGRPPVPSR